MEENQCTGDDESLLVCAKIEEEKANVRLMENGATFLTA